jgi:A/G-specific adenine glycosylase
MELGATVCFRQNPLCTVCPVRTFCAAGQRGDAEKYPRLQPKKLEHHAVLRLWCERGGSLLLHRAASDARRFANIYELPTADQAGRSPDVALRGKLLGKKKRGITRFVITESIHTAAAPRGKLLPGLAWVPFAKLETITLSGPHRRWVNEILASARKNGA